MKYVDKAWCERDAAAANGGAATRTSSSSSKSSSSRRKPKTTSAPVPATPAAADPFGFDSIAPSSANNTSWDAFGAAPAPPPAANFQADFGNTNATSSASAAVAPPAAAPAFQADFGGRNGTTVATPQQPPAPAATAFQANFGNNFSHPTMVSMPPPSPQGQHQQQQMQPPMPQPQQQNQQQQQQPFQANFNQGMIQSPTPQQQQQQQEPVQQNPFQANLYQGQMMQQQQVRHQHQPPASVPSPDFQANFDQVSQNSMMPTTQQHQQPQQSFQTNFGQPPATMAPQQQRQPPQLNVVPTQTQNVQGVGGEMAMNQQAGGTNHFGQFPQQQQQQMVNDQQGGMNTTQQMPPVPQQLDSMNVQSNGSANTSQIPGNQPQQPKQELQPEAMNPNAFMSADDKKDAFSAFNSLSLEPTNSRGDAKTPVREVGNDAAKKPKDLQFSKYKQGQQVVYTNAEGSAMAFIKKVHFDDALQPFYTIDLNGREKQTDDAHLSLPDDTTQNQQSQPSTDSTDKLEETATMLKNLSESQLLEVQQFIANLQPSAQPTSSMPSMGMGQQEQNDTGISYSQQQMSGMPYQQTAGMGGIPIRNQNVVAQQNSMPPPQMASMQQPNQMQGNMGGMPTHMTTQQPMMHHQQPAQMSHQPAMQQTTQVQGIGNTGMPQVTMQQQPMMPNTGSSAQTQQQQVPNPSMMQPMGVSQPYAASPTMAPTAIMPPVEKEGNPFDVY